MLTRALLAPLVARALEEDLAGGDITTEATVEATTDATAHAGGVVVRLGQ